jgi:hypothetical protein
MIWFFNNSHSAAIGHPERQIRSACFGGDWVIGVPWFPASSPGRVNFALTIPLEPTGQYLRLIYSYSITSEIYIPLLLEY